MTTSQITTNNYNLSIPKELSTASLGTITAGAANVAVQFLTSLQHSPSFLGKFIGFSCGATSIAATVITIYSAVHLSQKMISEKNKLTQNIALTALGVFATALAESLCEYFWKIASDPYFVLFRGEPLAYCIATNLAWQTALIAGVGGIAFTAYAAYRTGKAVLTTNAVK